MFLLGFLELHSFCTYCGYNEANNEQLGSWQKSEKCNRKGPPKVRGWLRHLPRLESPEQGTGGALNKHGVFFPYKHQFSDLVPSGLWLYNRHLCLCGSKMLNTISMG